MQPNEKPEIVEEAYTILMQLGGRAFLMITGSHKLMAAGISAHNPRPWLRMDLVPNKANVNRLKITLTPDDLYKMEFYHQELVDWCPVITNQHEFDGVYFDSLQEIFTEVTGLYTSL